MTDKSISVSTWQISCLWTPDLDSTDILKRLSISFSGGPPPQFPNHGTGYTLAWPAPLCFILRLCCSLGERFFFSFLHHLQTCVFSSSSLLLCAGSVPLEGLMRFVLAIKRRVFTGKHELRQQATSPCTSILEPKHIALAPLKKISKPVYRPVQLIEFLLTSSCCHQVQDAGN